MKTWLALLVLGWFSAAYAETSSSFRYGVIGYTETVRELAPVALKSRTGEDLVIGHKTTIFWCIAGVYVRDDGYVLTTRGVSAKHFPLPATRLEYQRAGLLPQNLPPYSIPLYEILIGYSFWIVLLCGGVVRCLQAARRYQRRINFFTRPTE